MHLWRAMRVHRIRQLVLALSGCWLGHVLVVLLLGETKLTLKVKIRGPEVNRCSKAVVGLTRKTRSDINS